MTGFVLHPVFFAMVACASSEIGDLDSPTTVTLRFDDQPLSEVLEALEDQTGVELAIESILPDEEEIASRRISIDVNDRPFWEAVELIADVAGLELETVDRDRVVLSTPSIVETEIRAGTPTTVGVFHVVPLYDTMFDEIELAVRPEPRIPLPYVVDYRAEITFANGERASYHPRPLEVNYPVAPSNVVGLQIENGPSFRPEEQILKGHKRARQIVLTAELRVPTGWREQPLPPLATIAPQIVSIDDGRLWIERARIRDPRYAGERNVRIYLRTEGVTQSEDADLEFALIAADGTRIDPNIVGVGKGDTDGTQWRSADVGFFPDKVPAELDSYRLAVRPSDGEETVIGPLGDLRPDPVSVGNVQITVDHFDVENRDHPLSPDRTAEVELTVWPFRIPDDRVRLDIGDGRRLEAIGHARSGVYPHTFSLTFGVTDVETNPDTWRLVVEVPTDSIGHTLRATLTDVRLEEEKETDRD